MPSASSVWFLGTSGFAVPSLDALVSDPRFSVDLVITQPDRPAGRKKELTASPVKIAAQSHKLQILQPEDINDATHYQRPTTHSPDFLIVVSFGQILSQEILDLPKIAPLNVHGSLLPRWRGASPIQHALLAGDAETGVTVQKMVKELDAGPILAQEKVMIGPRETYLSLHETLARRGASLLIKTLSEPLRVTPQDPKGITICRKLKREDGVVDSQRMTAEQIDRKVRALNPWPGVTLDGLKLLQTALEPSGESSPLPCAHGTVLHLITVQPAGKKAMSGAAWQRGIQGKPR